MRVHPPHTYKAYHKLEQYFKHEIAKKTVVTLNRQVTPTYTHTPLFTMPIGDTGQSVIVTATRRQF